MNMTMKTITTFTASGKTIDVEWVVDSNQLNYSVSTPPEVGTKTTMFMLYRQDLRRMLDDMDRMERSCASRNLPDQSDNLISVMANRNR